MKHQCYCCKAEADIMTQIGNINFPMYIDCYLLQAMAAEAFKCMQEDEQALSLCEYVDGLEEGAYEGFFD